MLRKQYQKAWSWDILGLILGQNPQFENHAEVQSYGIIGGMICFLVSEHSYYIVITLW